MAYSPIEKETLQKINEKEGTKYKLNQIMEWSTSNIDAQDGEKVYNINGIYMAIKVKP